jgi:hypothetical protein
MSAESKEQRQPTERAHRRVRVVRALCSLPEPACALATLALFGVEFPLVSGPYAPFSLRCVFCRVSSEIQPPGRLLVEWPHSPWRTQGRRQPLLTAPSTRRRAARSATTSPRLCDVHVAAHTALCHVRFLLPLVLPDQPCLQRNTLPAITSLAGCCQRHLKGNGPLKGRLSAPTFSRHYE